MNLHQPGTTLLPLVARGCVSLCVGLWLGLCATGCGEGATAFACIPSCPASFTCEMSGCVPGPGASSDLAVVVDALAGACAPDCAAPTPHCSPERQCVQCLEDAHCPIGSVCRKSGPGGPSGSIRVCAPGCSDDARCGDGKRCCGGECVDVTRSPQHCGSCGTACRPAHGQAGCVAGVCAAGVCDRGWADCNLDVLDGCEAYLRIDPRNCTACGKACAPQNAVGACAGGCYIAACDFGFDDCNSEIKDGCEVALLSDTRNCGHCAYVCPGVPRAVVACSLGACVLQSCNQGFGDCNRAFVDGCEVNLSNDRLSCGACGVTCAQGQVCANAVCTCPPCSAPNAKAACVNQQCQVASCNQGWADCDGNYFNGCERNVATDVNHCGGCGLACLPGLVCANGGCTCPQCNIPNAVTKCVNNVCALDRCVPGFESCDGDPKNGCEVNSAFDASNCGQCGVVCPKQQPVCDRGVCSALPAPLLYFDAADANSYPGNGRVWTDLAGSGVTGTLINNITFGTVDNVKSLIFDGAGAGVNFPNAILDDSTFGGVYWVYSEVPQQIADQGGLYVNWTQRAWNPPNWVAFFKWGVDDWYFRVNNGGCCQDLTGSGAGGFAKNIPQKKWTMVHFFYQVGTPNGWKWGANGKNVAVSTMASRAAGQSEPTSVIGWGHAQQGGYWIGGISSVRFYKVLLTDDDLALLFASTKGGYGL